MLKVFFLLLNLMCFGSGRIKEINLSPTLQKCLNDLKAKYNMGNAIGYSLYDSCINTYVSDLLKKSMTDLNPVEKGYMNSLIRNVMDRRGRIKRQARRHTRREMRQMTRRERRNYHNAVNALKRQFLRGSTVSTYDIIANRHQGVLELGHAGPVFPGWHMVYLLVYEQALRRIDRTVTVPYYASHLDDAMGEPGNNRERLRSVVWSRRFFGNCDGEVTTGPYANWQTPNGPLMRQCGLFGSPYSYEALELIMANRLNAEIFFPDAQFDANVEVYHNALHSYIGGGVGQVSRLDFAPHDPVFFNLHAHIDKIWYDFKVRRRARDYPPFRNSLHSPDASLRFGTLTNRVSYTDITGLYTYQALPTCDTGCERNSPFYTCNSRLNPPRCRSLSRREARGIEVPPRGGRGRNEQPQDTTVRNERQNNATGGNERRPRKKRQTEILDFLNTKTLINNTEIEKEKPCEDSVLKRSMQNSFYIDGKVDSSNWVYIAVEVIYNRAPEKQNYNSYPMVNGRPAAKYDIYSPNVLPKLNSEVHPDKPKGFKGCEDPSLNAAMIFVGSHGLNYYGDYKEYVVADKRMAISSTTGYVAIKSPELNGSTDAIVSAHDSCGRICKAYCYIPGSRSEYRQCNGAISLSKENPKMYGKTIAECVERMWNFSKTGFCPKMVKSDVFLKFYCDYKEDWPWISGDTGVKPTNKPPLQTTKPPTECVVNDSCTIPRPCGRCNPNEKHLCIQGKNTYARCTHGHFHVFKCYRNFYYDSKTKMCRYKGYFRRYKRYRY